jgi:hypothetical protein
MGRGWAGEVASPRSDTPAFRFRYPRTGFALPKGYTPRRGWCPARSAPHVCVLGAVARTMQAPLRGIWEKYYESAHGVVFVVDSSDEGRFIEARNVLGGVQGAGCSVRVGWLGCMHLPQCPAPVRIPFGGRARGGARALCIRPSWPKYPTPSPSHPLSPPPYPPYPSDSLCAHDLLADVPFLILANKCDIPVGGCLALRCPWCRGVLGAVVCPCSSPPPPAAPDCPPSPDCPRRRPAAPPPRPSAHPPSPVLRSHHPCLLYKIGLRRPWSCLFLAKPTAAQESSPPVG